MGQGKATWVEVLIFTRRLLMFFLLKIIEYFHNVFLGGY